MPVSIGIDLGTTSSTIAGIKNNSIEIIRAQNGEMSTPSYIAFYNDDFIFREDARLHLQKDPQNTFFHLKRLVGKRYTDPVLTKDLKNLPFAVTNDRGTPQVIIQNKDYFLEEILSKYIKFLVENANNQLNTDVTEAVVCVPLSYTHTQREVIKNSAYMAGLTMLTLVNETSSAALCYVIESKMSDNGKIVLVHIGGGGL